MTVDMVVFTGALLFLAILGWWGVRRIASEEQYLLASRGIGLFPLVATLVMTEFNTSTLIAFSSMGYVAGIWALSLPMVFLVGLLFYSVTVARKWKEVDGFSVAELFTRKYGATVGKLASGSLLVAMAGFSAVYVKSMTLLFHPLLPELSFWVLSLLLVGVILGMTLRGGLISVIQTDVGSFFLLCLVMPLLLFFAWQQAPATVWVDQSWTDMSTALPPWLVISLTLLTMFTYILAPWYGQKMFAASSPKVATIATAIAAVLVFFFYGCGVLAVSCLSATPLNSPDNALPHLILHCLPIGLKGLALALLFAAAATTLTGVWSAMTTMLIGDFLGKSEGIRKGIWITLAWALVSYFLANLLVDQIFQKLILANIPVLALSFALLAGFYWPKVTPKAAYSSILVGLFWGISIYLHFGEEGGYQWYWVMWGLPLIFATGVTVTWLEILTRRSDDIHVAVPR